MRIDRWRLGRRFLFVMSISWGLRYNGPLGIDQNTFGVKVEASKLA